MRIFLLVSLAILLVLAGGLIVFYGVRMTRQQVAAGQEEVDYGGPLDHFELTQSTSEPFDSRDLDGKVWIASFFYSTCTTECREMNEAKKMLTVEFGHRGVKFVSITCDAPVDTPAKLHEESTRLNADPDTWYFLTGEQEYIEKVGKDIFMVPVKRHGHSPHFIVVDRSGEVHGYFNFKNEAQLQELRELVEKLLREEPPAEETPTAESGESRVEGGVS